MPRTLRLLLLPLLLLVCPSCGNGGSNIERQVVRIQSNGPLDGWIRSDGELDTRLGTPGAGDLANGQEVRTFYSFDIAQVPAGATIESAVLHFRQVYVLNFILQLNPLLIEHIDYGDTLNRTDFTLLPLGTPSTLRLDEFNLIRSIDVTLLVQQDADANRPRSQFRLRMSAGTNGNSLSDFVAFETGDNAHRTGDRPSLEVTYTIP